MKLVSFASTILLLAAGCSAQQESPESLKLQVVVSAIKIRTKPSTQATAVGQYNHCDAVEYVQNAGQSNGYDWVQVKWHGGTYYAANGPVGGEAWMVLYPAPGC